MAFQGDLSTQRYGETEVHKVRNSLGETPVSLLCVLNILNNYFTTLRGCHNITLLHQGYHCFPVLKLLFLKVAALFGK